MATTYTINYSDPARPTFTLVPGQVNSTIHSIILYGEFAPAWGEGNNENFLHLLENFASPIEPSYPTEGQTWYDSAGTVIKVWNGSAWIVSTGVAAGITAPAPAITGQLWFDTDNDQLNVYDGSVWESTANHYLPLIGGTISGNLTIGGLLTVNGTLDMTGDKITNLGNPDNPQDASTRTYTNTEDDKRLLLTGGILSGELDMGNNLIINVPYPTLPSHAVNRMYVDDQIISQDQINELSDVNITAVANKELLSFDTSSGRWINRTADQADIYDKNAANSRFIYKFGDTITGQLVCTGTSGNGGGFSPGEGRFALRIDSTADLDGGGILVDCGDNNGDENAYEAINHYGGGGTVQTVFSVKATSGIGYFRGVVKSDIPSSSITDIRHLTTKQYVDNEITLAVGGQSASLPVINPAVAKDGDLNISGSTIKIYAGGAWRQIFPAQYSA